MHIFKEKLSSLHMVKQNYLHFFPKIQQYVRSIEYNEKSLNLINTNVLTNNTKHNTFNTSTSLCIFLFVSFFHTHKT